MSFPITRNEDEVQSNYEPPNLFVLGKNLTKPQIKLLIKGMKENSNISFTTECALAELERLLE